MYTWLVRIVLSGLACTPVALLAGPVASAGTPTHEAAVAVPRVDPLFTRSNELRHTARSLGGFTRETAWGWSLGSNAAAADRGALEMRAAAEAFLQLFDIHPGAGVVVDVQLLGRIERQHLASFDWMLPWFFAESVDLAPADAVPPLASEASALLAHLVTNGLLERTPELDRVVTRFRRGLDSTEASDAGHTSKLQSALRHEIAHKLFVKYCWPGTREGQYGSDAPDWLDEMAAIAVESASLTDQRRMHFADMVVAGRLTPLEKYLRQPHPTYDAPELQSKIAELRQQARKTGITIGIYRKSDLGLTGTEGPDFYAQTRALLDFMTDAANGYPPLQSIVRSLRSGTSFERWLKDNGSAVGLASDLESLDSQFRAWSAAR